MSFNLLKYQAKSIQAKTDIAYGRLVLDGPRWEVVQGGRGIPFEKVRTGPASNGLRPKGSDFQPHWGYDTRMSSPGDKVDVDQEIAYHLCVKENLATLIKGGAFSIIEERDGAHLIKQWYPKPWGPPHALFQAIEKVEVMSDGFNLGCDIPVPAGTQMRVRSEDYFQGAHPKDFLWEGEPADIPRPDGTGNPNHWFRILRPSPVSKQVALRQQEQTALIGQLWGKVFPGAPLGSK